MKKIFSKFQFPRHHYSFDSVFHSAKEIPKVSEKDKRFSVDVFTMDENGMHGLAFYSFEDSGRWIHSDNVTDYFEKGNEENWKWYYPPFEKKDIMHNQGKLKPSK